MKCSQCPNRGDIEVDGGMLCRSDARRLADRLARRLVVARDRGKCRRCGDQDRGVQWAHVLGRRVAPALRWDPANAIALCAGCHADFTIEPKRFEAWLEAEEPGLRIALTRRQQQAESIGIGHGLPLGETIDALRLRVEEEAA